ncbi:MAG: CBS domain-containing protein [Pseudoprimorskyibacter sp.]|jgi:CBS domain-containing protein|nr:CBS domain-containing protein [Pseudoprimorskyibacter sp.]
MKVVQILKSKADDGVVTVMPGSDVGAATEILAERKIGTVVVSPDGETAVGILSERDIVRELARIGASCLRHSVEDYMTSHLVTCTRDESADLVLSKMTKGRFRHMPVVEDGRLVGLITLGDVVKARLSEVSMEKEALESMIMGH